MAIKKGSWYWRARWLARTLFWPIFLLLVIVIPVWHLLLAYFQGEARSTLNAIVKDETSYRQMNGSWAGTFDDFNFVVDKKGRYTYFLSPDEFAGRPPEELGLTFPVNFEALGAPEPGMGRDGLVVVAIGNIDLDPGLDVWWTDETLSMNNPQNDISGIWQTIKDVVQLIKTRLFPPGHNSASGKGLESF